ncbi:MAG: 4-phosphoerythronate dehydrogenase [Candidatus Kryptoniota bacterium]
MKIVADQKIPYIDLAFDTFGALVKLESGAIDNTMVRDADALIVRSETRVDEKLLTGSKLSFVGTATIGTDHVDTDFLDRNGINFSSAPGCNANAVVQYIFSALFAIAKEKDFALRGKTLGVVGVGNVGSKIVRVAKALGMSVLENDPPLARSTGDSRFVSLDELNQADIITLHVPLTNHGSDPTFHLFNEKRISKMKSGAILINSSRGPVVETTAMEKALAGGKLSVGVLDVWEDEPNIESELLSLCAIGTPHIAGYSIDGKVNATRMIYQAFCEHFNFPQTWDANGIVPSPKNPVITID